MIVNRRRVTLPSCPPASWTQPQTLMLNVSAWFIHPRSVLKECYCGTDGRGSAALHLSKACLLSWVALKVHTWIHLKQAHKMHFCSHTQLSSCVCVCVTVFQTVRASPHVRVMQTLLFLKASHGCSHESHRLVSSHAGSLMLFNTFLTTFSRSLRALCSSSSDLFIFLLSCVGKQSWKTFLNKFIGDM